MRKKLDDQQGLVGMETDKCFKSADCITHGGSHFLEVVIPFIKYKSE